MTGLLRGELPVHQAATGVVGRVDHDVARIDSAVPIAGQDADIQRELWDETSRSPEILVNVTAA
ncbi:hypothetical protein ACWGDT_35685 [Streptomyces avermitilis]